MELVDGFLLPIQVAHRERLLKLEFQSAMLQPFPSFWKPQPRTERHAHKLTLVDIPAGKIIANVLLVLLLRLAYRSVTLS